MALFPVLLDTLPSYLDADASSGSLLQLPLGNRTLLARVCADIARVTAVRPLVLPAFTLVPAYQRAMLVAHEGVEIIPDEASLWARIIDFEPSDRLLLLDPSCYAPGGIGLDVLVAAESRDIPTALHLVLLEGGEGRTAEFVRTDTQGQVRKIQRYYQPVTWPFATGIVSSLIPIVCMDRLREHPLSSLPGMRRALGEAGVPSRDVPLGRSVYDLSDVGGVLGLNEHYVEALLRPMAKESRSRHGRQYRGANVEIHASARLLGPVALLDGAVIEQDAVIIGPTLIGANARVSGVVAQCVVMPGTHVPAASTVRHSVITNATLATAQGPRRHTPGRHRAQPSVEEVAVSSRGVYRRMKRLLDATLAATAVLALAPFMAVIAVLIKLSSRGPVLYGGEREGKHGKPFRCWKFRSMRLDADARQRELAALSNVDGPQFKIPNDPRVTPIGAWLRRNNIDELPQLLNVLRGEMSLVGPRPSPFRENQVCIPWRQGRLSVLPGITGLWQICRHDRDQGDFHQWIQYDLLYVRHASFWLDLKILVATIVSLGGRRVVPLATLLPTQAGKDKVSVVSEAPTTLAPSTG